MGVARHKKAREALEGGDRVMVSFPCRARGETQTRYVLVELSKSISERTWQKLKPELEPTGDGLFNDGASQTYKLKGVP